MKHAVKESKKNNRTKAMTLTLMVMVVFCCFVGLAGADSPSVSVLNRPTASHPFSSGGDVTDQHRRIQALDVRVKNIEKTLEQVEARLGRAVHPPTLTRNVERRLQDIERRLDGLERELKRFDTVERTVNRIETRLRRVESRRQ